MSTKEVKINIYNEVGGRAAVSDIDGNKLFEKINLALKGGNSVLLDFINIEILTSAFLNTAIGQLYKEDYDVEFLRKNVKTSNMQAEDWEILKSVLVRAKEYYHNPDYKLKLEEAIKEELDND